MAKCSFDNKLNTLYNCEYEIDDGLISVTIEYNIENEIETQNGIIFVGPESNFKKRDIYIIDHSQKVNYLLKNAWYRGQNKIYGSPDGGEYTTFSSNLFFKSNNIETILELKKSPKVSKIMIFSPGLSDILGYPSLTTVDSAENVEYLLNKNSQTKSIDINSENIMSITLGDQFNARTDYKTHVLTIKFSAYIEIKLDKEVKYDLIYKYIFELIIYLQLFRPDKFDISKILLNINDKYIEFFTDTLIPPTKERNITSSVDDVLLSFLQNCYRNIPYRKGKRDVRNIPYIVLNTGRNLEDNFLMFYRFIESHYKIKNKPGTSNNFISHSLINHSNIANDFPEKKIGKEAAEIVSLRNHYVHAGYYIKNSSLRVNFREKEYENYTLNNVNVDWIYDKTTILYNICINILFTELLGYDNYKFDRHY